MLGQTTMSSYSRFGARCPAMLSSCRGLVLGCILSLCQVANTVFIPFDNCLSTDIIDSSPLELQFVPIYFDARFDTHNPSHNLNITIYGNVSGQATEGVYPPADSSDWSNSNITFGKIVNISPTNDKYSTLFQRYQVLTYDAYSAPAAPFCNSTVNDTCPLGPSFGANASDPYQLSAFTVAHDFYSSYAFATFAASIVVQSGDKGAPELACISASITPDLGKTLAGLLTYLPAAVLIFVAIATAAAAMYSPWGSVDPFKWTTNYGRDEDLLRLVTPGFGDCLQYIQFVFLTGALSLNYPGFYQPATSQASWAALQFNESFVSHGHGTQSLIDGIYLTNGTYGLTRMSQLVGMSHVRDVWACLAIWLVVLAAAAIALCQFAFLMHWVYLQVTNTVEEDLRRKNWPFTAGMLVRIVYNYFLLPTVALSMYQFVVAPRSPASVVAMAVILLVAIIAFAGWILHVVFNTKPRSHLFDHLPTVLLYGSLYNTYSDDAAPFALIPAVLTFMRGVVIGAVQPSGIAQLIVLAICEVILILTLHAFRPFHSPTSMNAYHTFFAVMRLVSVLLMVAFVPSLDVTEASKGWVGYAILLLHAIVLVFGFFMNAVQTLVEVAARMAGAGGDPQHGAARGGLISYSWRQLAQRQPDRAKARPGSMTSNAAILANDSDAKSFQMMSGRSRSFSASSQILLNHPLPLDRRTSNFDNFDSVADFSPETPGADTPGPSSGLGSFNFFGNTTESGQSSKKNVLGLKTKQPPADPYYRAPRQRRETLDPLTPGSKSRQSVLSGEWTSMPEEDSSDKSAGANESGEGPSFSTDRDTPSPAYLRHNRGVSDPEAQDGHGHPTTDYAVREVDFYYGVRGPALSNTPARKLKTGPADPMGPVSNATTWFQRLMGGQSKEKGKGFEVVRSSRAPPTMLSPRRGVDDEGQGQGQELQTSPPMTYPPYHDSPEAQTAAGAEAARNRTRMQLDGTWDDEDGSIRTMSPPTSPLPTSSPPFLKPISRSGSLNMGWPSRSNTVRTANQPTVPRKNSRRPRSQGAANEYIPTLHEGTLYEGTATSQGDHETIPTLHESTLYDDRPTSMGHVQHRTAADSMYVSGIGEASAAEFVHSGQARSDRTMSFD